MENPGSPGVKWPQNNNLETECVYTQDESLSNLVKP